MGFPFNKYCFYKLILIFGILLTSCQNKSDSNSSSPHKYIRDQSGDLNENDKAESSLYSIKSTPGLFPSESEPILVSFYLRYIEPPPLDKRQKIISNYDSQNLPLAGWAISMTLLRTSLRLELYLKDSNGVGGWYTLAPLPVSNSVDDRNQWYATSFLIAPGNFISSLYSKVNSDFTPSKHDQSYVTGVSIEPFGQIESDAIFKITSGASKNSSLRVEIKELAIFKLKNMPNKTEFLNAAKGGSRKLKELYKANCTLAIDGAGEDFCEIYSKNN